MLPVQSAKGQATREQVGVRCSSNMQQPRHGHVHYQPVSLGLHTAVYVSTQLHVHAELADEC